jgi:hypothetical protein
VLFVVQAIDGGLRFLIGSHFYKCEPLASTRFAIFDHLGADNCSELTEHFLQFRTGNPVIEVTHIQLLAHLPTLLKEKSNPLS